jgi:tRNA (guanine-N7-)-methyltransferase
MKTDNNDLFEYSVDQLESDKWEFVMITRDLHKSHCREGNIMTEYEEKFVSEGKKINKLVVRKKNG